VTHTVAKQKKVFKGIVPALARPGDPLVTASGQQIKPEKSKKHEKPQPEITAKNFKSTRQRTLGELPATPQVVNGCAIVIMYSIMGLGDREIAIAAKISHEDVLAVKMHPAYEECFDIIAKEFVSANSALLAARVSAYAHDAVTKIADISMNGKQETNQLRASVHLHESATGTKGGQQGANSNMRNELRIVIVEGDRKPVDIEVNGNQFRSDLNGQGSYDDQ